MLKWILNYLRFLLYNLSLPLAPNRNHLSILRFQDDLLLRNDDKMSYTVSSWRNNSGRSLSIFAFIYWRNSLSEIFSLSFISTSWVLILLKSNSNPPLLVTKLDELPKFNFYFHLLAEWNYLIMQSGFWMFVFPDIYSALFGSMNSIVLLICVVGEI